MRNETVYYYNSREELLRAFANEVVDNFNRCLEIWDATSNGGESEKNILSRKLHQKTSLVYSNAYEKLAEILSDDKDKKYAKKVGPFKSRRYVSITWYSGFYDHLLKGGHGIKENEESIQSMAATNVEYIIDKKKLSIEKMYYPVKINP